MAPPLLALREMRLTFGGGDLFSGVDLAIHERDRLALVGRNGSGKSTLLKVVASEIEADGGEIFRQPGVRVAYLAQEPSLDGFETILDFVLAELGDHEAEYAHRAKILLESVKILSTADPKSLSGGEARRAALARALVADPDILLLDEPTNHLDMPTIEWLEDELKAYRGAIVMISHDRKFLESISNAIIWLDRGQTRRLDKNFAEFETWSQDVLDKEREERAKLDKLIAEETRWSHEGITARRKRNMGRMRRLWELRDQRSKQISQIGKVTLEVDSGSSSGKEVIVAEDISKSFGDRDILKPFSTRILRGDRIGIIGPNGAGKSTLLKMLTGNLAPDTGSVKLGTNLQATYFDQRRTLLDPEKSLWDTLADVGGDQIMVRGVPRHVVTYLKEFLFDERQARTPVKALSGGEQNRLMLAKHLAQPTNLLILDEPTNDLDMETLDLLQEMLADYDGTLLLVSHDRDFLDRVVTSTIAFEGEGVAREYPGGYSDFFKQRKEVREEAQKAAKKKTEPADKPKFKSKSKLSYKEQRDLELLPTKIEELEAEIVDLEAALADPALFTKSPDKFQAKSDRLTAANEERDAAEERWLELEMLREELAEG